MLLNLQNGLIFWSNHKANPPRKLLKQTVFIRRDLQRNKAKVRHEARIAELFLSWRKEDRLAVKFNLSSWCWVDCAAGQRALYLSTWEPGYGNLKRVLYSEWRRKACWLSDLLPGSACFWRVYGNCISFHFTVVWWQCFSSTPFTLPRVFCRTLRLCSVLSVQGVQYDKCVWCSDASADAEWSCSFWRNISLIRNLFALSWSKSGPGWGAEPKLAIVEVHSPIAGDWEVDRGKSQITFLWQPEDWMKCENMSSRTACGDKSRYQHSRNHLPQAVYCRTHPRTRHLCRDLEDEFYCLQVPNIDLGGKRERCSQDWGRFSVYNLHDCGCNFYSSCSFGRL